MSVQVPDEPTPGETKIVLDGILGTLNEIRSTQATQEFVSLKFEALNDRVDRIERDSKNIRIEHAASSTELKSLITDRINALTVDFDEELKKTNKRIDDIIERSAMSDRERRNRTIGISMALFGALLSLIVSVTNSIINSQIVP